MKIAVFHNLPDGGALRTVYEQVKGLSKKHRVDLYQFDRNLYKDIRKYVRKVNFFDFNLENSFPSVFNRFYKDYKNFVLLCLHHKKLAELIDNRNYDIVLVHSDKWTESPYLLRFLKTKNIYHCHELLRIAYEESLKFDEEVSLIKKGYEAVTRTIRKYIDWTNARSAGFIITSSNYINHKVKNVYQKKATSLHTGVDSSVFKPIKSKRTNILYVGGKSNYKGYDTYKKIVKILSNKQYNFIEIGYGRGERKITSDRQMAKEYSSAVAVLCLARQEPFGLVPLEAMSCETPVVTVNEGGYKETILNKETGFLLSRNPVSIAKKVKFLISNPKIVQKLGSVGRKHVIKDFSWQQHVRLLEKHMLSIVNE
jgi:glycosyltransferase involved in cell wall biosynthesis